MMNHTVGVRPPPPGVTPDFNSRPWLLNANRIAVAVGLTLSTLFLIIRLYAKVCIIRSFWWDDVSISLAWVFSIGTQATILYGYANSGFAIHIWNIPLPLIVSYRKTILALAVLYLPALAFAKLAVIMLYYRVLESVRMWRYTLWLVGVGICGYSIALIFALIFACNPFQAGWNLSAPSACRHRSGIYLGTAIANTASDVVLIIIPITFMWRMHLPLLQKIGILCLFGIGCLTVVTSIARLVTLIPLLASNDQPHNLGLACLFIVIEANFIILCGSIPYTRHFVRHHGPKIISQNWNVRTRLSSNEIPPPQRHRTGPKRLPDDIEMAMNEPCDINQSEYNMSECRAEDRE